MRGLLMKQVSIAAVLFLVTQSLLAGGVSGGGGHVINPSTPETYQDPKQIEEMIKCTIKPVQAYLLKKHAEYQYGLLPADQAKAFGKVFTAPKSIHEAFKKVKMDVPDEQSCFDYDNQPVDGSIFHENKRQVCISAKNIADKVRIDEVKAQSGALIIHEYSEIVGLNEEEAVELQKISLEDFTKNPIKHDDDDDDDDGGSYKK